MLIEFPCPTLHISFFKSCTSFRTIHLYEILPFGLAPKILPVGKYLMANQKPPCLANIQAAPIIQLSFFIDLVIFSKPNEFCLLYPAASTSTSPSYFFLRGKELSINLTTQQNHWPPNLQYSSEYHSMQGRSPENTSTLV